MEAAHSRIFHQLSELQNNQTEAIEKYLTLWSGGQLFGIGIAQVVQIIQVQEITASLAVTADQVTANAERARKSQRTGDGFRRGSAGDPCVYGANADGYGRDFHYV